MKTYQRAKEQLGEIISAIEVMDSQTMDLVRTKLNLKSPIDEYPFYLFIETFGSNQEHDQEKLNSFLDNALNRHLVLNGTVITDNKKYEVFD